MSSEPRHIRFSPDLADALRANASADSVTQSEYLRALVRDDTKRRARFAVDPRTADSNLLYFRIAHGDVVAMVEFGERLIKLIDEEEVSYRRFELFGVAMVFLRLAAERGSADAQCNYASALLVRSEVAREMGENDFADALHADAMARYDIAADGDDAGIFSLLNAAVASARPSMVQAAQSARDRIVKEMAEREI